MAVIRTNRLVVGEIVDLSPLSSEPWDAGGKVSPLGFSGVRRPGQDVWTCPAGKRAILRHLDLSTIIAPIGGFDQVGECWAFIGAGGTAYTMIFGAHWLASNLSAHWTGTCVFFPGDTLWVEGTQARLGYQASGAILDDPS
jgi:hypothetical protein